MKRFLPPAALLLLPLTTHAQTIQDLFDRVTVFVSGVLIPFLLAVAVVAFLYNAFQYFILQAADSQAHSKAKTYMVYSIVAFVAVLLMWGFVNILVEGLGINSTGALTPDYN